MQCKSGLYLQVQGAELVSRGCAPEVEEENGTAAPGRGKAAKLGCSKCRMSRKGCSVCRVKAGLTPLSKTFPSPRRYTHSTEMHLVTSLP